MSLKICSINHGIKLLWLNWTKSRKKNVKNNILFKTSSILNHFSILRLYLSPSSFLKRWLTVRFCFTRSRWKINIHYGDGIRQNNWTFTVSIYYAHASFEEAIHIHIFRSVCFHCFLQCSDKQSLQKLDLYHSPNKKPEWSQNYWGLKICIHLQKQHCTWSILKQGYINVVINPRFSKLVTEICG